MRREDYPELPTDEVIVVYTWQGTREDGQVVQVSIGIDGDWWAYEGMGCVSTHEARADNATDAMLDATNWLKEKGYRSRYGWDGPKLEY